MLRPCLNSQTVSGREGKEVLKYSEVSPPKPGWESDPIEAICLL